MEHIPHHRFNIYYFRVCVQTFILHNNLETVPFLCLALHVYSFNELSKTVVDNT